MEHKSASKEELAHLKFVMRFNEGSIHQKVLLRKSDGRIDQVFTNEVDALLQHMEKHFFYLEVMPYLQEDREEAIAAGEIPRVTFTSKVYGRDVEGGDMYFDLSCNTYSEAFNAALTWYRDLVLPILDPEGLFLTGS